MKVDQLMCRNVHFVSSEGSLADAARVMWEGDCGCVPVIDDDARIVGMITDRDICMGAYMRGQPLHDLSIAESMSAQIQCCRPDDDVNEAARVMQTSQLRRLPVIAENGRVVGILSLNDIARAANRPPLERAMSLDEVAQMLGAICRPRDQAQAPLPQ